MVAVTYGVTRVPAAKAVRAKVAAPRKNVFLRFMDALVAPRMKQVHREIARACAPAAVHARRARQSRDQQRR